MSLFSPFYICCSYKAFIIQAHLAQATDGNDTGAQIWHSNNCTNIYIYMHTVYDYQYSVSRWYDTQRRSHMCNRERKKIKMKLHKTTRNGRGRLCSEMPKSCVLSYVFQCNKTETSNLSKAHEPRDSLSSSCSQIVLVCLQPFRRNSPLKCASQPKIAKKHWNPLFWRFKVIQGHRCQYR